MLEVEFFLQAPARVEKAIGAVLRDRAALAFALGFEGAPPFAHLGAAPFRTGHELPGIEL